MRDDKDAVLDMLFAAFEKHQYYNIRDLVKITRQPIVNNVLFTNNIFIYIISILIIIYSFILYIGISKGNIKWSL